jgi:hypothetical protein
LDIRRLDLIFIKTVTKNLFVFISHYSDAEAVMMVAGKRFGGAKRLSETSVGIKLQRVVRLRRTKESAVFSVVVWRRPHDATFSLGQAKKK